MDMRNKHISSLPADTALEMIARQFEILAGMDIEQKARMTFELSDNIRAVTMAGIRQMHPDYSDDEIKKEFIKRLYGVTL
jgi:Glu-tRNA(Gln) amidotransferase subunit E-like FAD-binding protein